MRCFLRPRESRPFYAGKLCCLLRRAGSGSGGWWQTTLNLSWPQVLTGGMGISANLALGLGAIFVLASEAAVAPTHAALVHASPALSGMVKPLRGGAGAPV